MDRAQAYGIDVPETRCEECGYLFTTTGDEKVCPDCRAEEEAEDDDA